MTTVHISIGNTDGKLTHEGWRDFCASIDGLLPEVAIYGRWHSYPASGYENACWAVRWPGASLRGLRDALSVLAGRYGQDSIAILTGETEFVLPDCIAGNPIIVGEDDGQVHD